ncbi:hypothetical protein BH11MYX3_BH11MYX3_14370 [soil metagenome]
MSQTEQTPQLTEPEVPSAIERMLTLRQFPGFDEADLSELAIVADNVKEEAFQPGQEVIGSGRSPALILVVEGTLVGSTSGKLWNQHEVLHTLEAMAGRRTKEAIVARTTARTLRIAAKDFVEILEDNFGFLCNVRRTLARRLISVTAAPPPSEGVEIVDSAPQPLGMVERLITLRKHVPFAKGRIEALAALALASEEIRLPANAQIGVAGEPASSVLILLEGTAQIARPGGPPVVVGPGHAIGALETLGELPFTATIRGLAGIRALRFPASALFDVLEDHTDLALSMVGSFAAAMLDAGLGEPFTDPSHVN